MYIGEAKTPAKSENRQISATNILGVKVHAINMEMAVNTIDGWIFRSERHYVCLANAYGLVEGWRDEDLQRVYNGAGLVTPDGMPLVWLSRFSGHSHVDRVYGPDLMLAVCARSITRKYRHFFYGGGAGVADKLVERMRFQFPDLRVAGTYSPPFRPLTAEEDRQAINHINSSQADIVWVGIGAPKQERWMAEHLGRLNAPVLIGVGAAFDFHAGLKQQAPRWMRQSGLEWSFRLMTEPRRLWRRYLINNPFFLWLIFLQALGRKPATHASIKPANGVGRSISIRKLLMMRRNMMTATGTDERFHSVWQKPGEGVNKKDLKSRKIRER